MKKILSISILLISVLFISSCKDDDTNDTPTPSNNTRGSATVMFEHKFGATDFKLNTEYTNASAEKITFTKVKYYISNIKLIKDDNTVWEQPESYHLVDASNSMSAMLPLKDVPFGTYKGITYTIGVDSTRNVSGAQTGALDPANTMFWSWNTGYIFMKFEGTSPQSSTGSFSYHIGGFLGANNAIRTNTVNFTMMKLEVKDGGNPMVHFATDLQKVFDGANDNISVANFNKTHMPGPQALRVANNFSQAITLDHIHN
jgi:hypothetical protein